MAKQLSIIVPGIRPHNWDRLYKSTNFPPDEFEMIFIGPTDAKLPYPNVKFIKDYGNPTRAMNIGLENSEGEYIHWEADDAIFLEEEPFRSFREALHLKDKEILTSKYLEGTGNEMLDSNIYRIHNAMNCRGLYVNPNYLILNTGFVKRNIAIESGGWDSQNFVTLFFAHTDLAIRLQNKGYELVLSTHPIARCEHMPTITGDHAPIHYAHIREDQPNFNQIYSHYSLREDIDIHNWIHTPCVWQNRFNLNLKANYIEKDGKYECVYEE